MTVLTLIGLWFAISIIAGLLIGRGISALGGGETAAVAEPDLAETLTTYSFAALGSPADPYRAALQNSLEDASAEPASYPPPPLRERAASSPGIA